MKHKTLALMTVSAIVVGAGLFTLYIYAFTTDGVPAGTCPEFSFVSGRQNIPFKLLILPNASQSVGSGPIYWCVYGSNNFLVRSYQTNTFPTPPSVSANGEYVALSGFQRVLGSAGTYGHGSIYLFDKSGQMLWNVSASQLSWESAINSNGSVVIGYGQDLYYISNQGKVLWNYSSSSESITAALVNDGSYVVDGTSYAPQTYGPPNSTMVGTNLVLFNSTGKTVWNDSIPGEVIESVTSVAYSNGHIALGVEQFATGQSTLLYYDLQGKLIWSKAINLSLANDDVYFQNNGSQIYVETYPSGHVIFDLDGNEIGS